MAFDGFILNAVTYELKSTLIGGKVQKIYEPNPNEILLSIYSNSLQYALDINISSNLYSAFLTTSKKENPLYAPNFCMLLRKHIMGFKISNIYTMNLERILILELTGNDENYVTVTKKLIVELMGKHSNILLVNNENIIIDSLKHFSIQTGSNRNIMPRYSYVLPSSNKLDISLYTTLEPIITSSSTSLTNFFVNNFVGISKTLIEHSIKILNIENILTIENYNKLAKYLLDLKNNITFGNVKCISLENDDYVLTNSQNSTNLQINFFLDDYYTKKSQNEQFVAYRNQLLNFVLGKLKKISKKLATVEEKLVECDKMEEYKLYGELITSYLYQISKEHTSSITLNNYYNNNEPINIPLDISISPAENSKKFFKKYHKLKNTFVVVQNQKSDLEKELNYLESIVYEIQSATTITDLDAVYEELNDAFMMQKKQNSKKALKNKKQKKLNTTFSPISYQVDGFKVLVGKNNKQNDELTFRVANKEDIWLHVKDFHGSHVILCLNGKTPSQDVINKCAAISAYHSKAMQSSNVAVDYTFVKYVKKPNKAKPRYGYLYKSKNC